MTTPATNGGTSRRSRRVAIDRRRKPAEQRKRKSLTIRVLDRLRDQLEKAAAISQRSVSEEVAHRLFVSFHDETPLDVKYLRRIDHKKGDQYVLTYPGKISIETVERLKLYWQENMGKDVKIMVLGDGLELSVIRTESD